MDQLKSFYRGSLKGLAGGIVTLALAYHGLLAALDVGPTAKIAVFLRWTESALVVVAFLGGEWLIRTRLWRIFKCRFDYAGEWTAETRYTNAEIGSGLVPAGPVNMTAKHSVTIAQDCFTIAISPTTGTYNNWYSLAMTILEEHRIGYVYQVNYSQPSDSFPTDAKGYEEMSVVHRQENGLLTGRPVTLTGFFYHCAQGKTPVYSGTVTFERVSRNATIKSVLWGE